MLLTPGCFSLASASCSRGAESLLAFLLKMLAERSRYTVSQSQPRGRDLTQPTLHTSHVPDHHPIPLSCAGPAMWHMLRVEGNQLWLSGCDISAASPTESNCCVLSTNTSSCQTLLSLLRSEVLNICKILCEH